MLTLYYSNYLEALTVPLANTLGSRRDPLRPATLIVPNRAIEQFIKFQIAQRLGVAANLRLEFIHNYLARTLFESQPDIRIASAGELHVLLLARLRDEALLDDPDMAPVRDYIDAGGEDPVARGRRAFQLAGRVARLFEEYGYSRVDMLDAWSRRSILDETPLAATERWQRRLWTSLFTGEQPPSLIADRDLRRRLLGHSFAGVDSSTLATADPVHVFGLSYVAPAFARIFAVLAQRIDVCIYALNPCLEYWEDVDSRRGARRKVVLAQAAPEIPGSDPFGLDEPGDTPALRLWGRPGRECIRLLNELTDCDFEPCFVDPTIQPHTGDAVELDSSRRPSTPAGRSGTLLEIIQRDMLFRVPEQPFVAPGEGRPSDGSVRFLACPGIQREVEIVANEIWSLIQANDADGADGTDVRSTLRFHEIAVIVNNSQRDAYLTHVAALFPTFHDLPFNLIDRRLSADSRVAEAIAGLVSLMGRPPGQIRRSDLLRLLLHPNIGGAVGEDDPEQWRAWAEELGVYIGADREALAGTYVDRDVFSWDQALRRLVLGTFLSGEPIGEGPSAQELRKFPWQGETYLPHQVTGDLAESAARFVRLSRSLLDDVRHCTTAALTLSEWTRFLVHLVQRYVVAQEAPDVDALGRCITAFEELGALELEPHILPYWLAQSFASRALEGLEGQRGHYMADGVAVSSLLPMRAIPFKVLFLLGMGEGLFPAGDVPDPLDLRQVRRLAGDVSPSARDRYLFLETLLSTRQQLYVSYVSRDAQTGEPLEPSSVIHELHHVLRAYVDEPTLTAMHVHHPVSRYDLRYFRGLEPHGAAAEARASGALASVSSVARRGAQSRALKAHLADYCSPAPPPRSLEALRSLTEPGLRESLDSILGVVGPELTASVPSGATLSSKEQGQRAHKASASDREHSARVQPKRLQISLSQIRRFLECPLQGAARFSLRLPEDDFDDLLAEVDEPIETVFLERLAMLREAFWRGVGAPDGPLAAYLTAFERRQLNGRLPAGPFALIQRDKDVRILEAWRVRADDLGVVELESFRPLRFGPAQAEQDEARERPPLTLELAGAAARSQASDRLRVEIAGTTPWLSADGSTSLRVGLGGKPADKAHLSSFIAWAAMAAAGTSLGERVNAVAINEGVKGFDVRPFRAFDPTTAGRWLCDIVTDLLAGTHAYLLPVEAVVAVRRAEKKAGGAVPVGPIVEATLTGRNSSLFGPVRHLDDFAPPEDDVARAIIGRRFGPFFDHQIDNDNP